MPPFTPKSPKRGPNSNRKRNAKKISVERHAVPRDVLVSANFNLRVEASPQPLYPYTSTCSTHPRATAQQPSLKGDLVHVA